MREQMMTPRLSTAAVAAEQLRAVGLAVRREVVVAGLLLSVLLLIGLIAQVQIDLDDLALYIDPGTGYGIVAAALAVLFPIAVWKAEHPFGDTPLWSLPVDHRPHMLMKVAVGWVWLMGALAAGLLILAAFALLTGGTLGVEETRLLLLDRAGAEAGVTGATRPVEWSTPLWQWLVPFTAATAAYLLATALLMGTRHPVWWLGGTWLLFLIVGMISEEGNIEWLNRAWEVVVWGVFAHPLGLDTLLTSGWEILTTGFETPSGETRSAWRALPSFGRWMAATALWTGLGVVALAAAIVRHRDH